MEALDLIVPGLGTAVGIGSSIYGGIKAGQERKRMSNFISGQQSDNEAWYNKTYYGNYMDRADTQALMKNLRDNLKTQSDRNAQTAVITGATPEAQLAAKEQANKAITDTTSRVAAMGQQWKDGVQNQYMQRKNQLSGMEYGEMGASANSFENLMGSGIKQVGNALSGIAMQSNTTADNANSSLTKASNTGTGTVVDAVRNGLYDNKTTK